MRIHPSSSPLQQDNLPQRRDIVERFRRVRKQSETLCKPLLPEDFNLQAIPEVSPPKWHLAHTTWFYEAFVLQEFAPSYTPYHPSYAKLFNSYYLKIGQPFPKQCRCLLSRPTIADVYEYRQCIDNLVQDLITDGSANQFERIISLIETGINHEQQHQELLLTDIKCNFSANPLFPVYCHGISPPPASSVAGRKPIVWVEFPSCFARIGASPGKGFAFDNEMPHHRDFVHRYALSDRPINNGEFLDFIGDGGYSRPEFWLADGWQHAQKVGWRMPMHWHEIDGKMQIYTLHGMKPLNLSEPVCHISYYEADAFARWAGARLPTEMEWENAASTLGVEGHFVCSAVLQPRSSEISGLRQMFGDVWEWTCSPYSPYPGYVAPQGAIGEYNGKFMCNQMVLRGGSCVSEREHIRATYRNFLYPWDRWQFSGLRLARNYS